MTSLSWQSAKQLRKPSVTVLLVTKQQVDKLPQERIKCFSTPFCPQADKSMHQGFQQIYLKSTLFKVLWQHKTIRRPHVRVIYENTGKHLSHVCRLSLLLCFSYFTGSPLISLLSHMKNDQTVSHSQTNYSSGISPKLGNQRLIELRRWWLLRHLGMVWASKPDMSPEQMKWKWHSLDFNMICKGKSKVQNQA